MPRCDTDTRWHTLTDDLALCLRQLKDDHLFILSHRDVNYYVQIAGSSHGPLRLEAANNTYIEPPSALLTVEQYNRMLALGWNAATHGPPELAVTPPMPGGSPNFHLDTVGALADLHVAAALLVATLRDVYGVGSPEALEYHCFHNEHGDISLEGFRVQRR